ncbi:hypothetical protein BJ742DRAFT_741067 [Cladochytrium replicatum]|nr:hypothetical protein BJ742DRAFT_741067 [Cladochytrium replicatum]
MGTTIEDKIEHKFSLKPVEKVAPLDTTVKPSKNIVPAVKQKAARENQQSAQVHTAKSNRDKAVKKADSMPYKRSWKAAKNGAGITANTKNVRAGPLEPRGEVPKNKVKKRRRTQEVDRVKVVESYRQGRKSC